MAVQQNKKSPSKRGMHRSHNALGVPGIAVEPTTGETHLRHHISPTGFYRGRKVLKTTAAACASWRPVAAAPRRTSSRGTMPGAPTGSAGHRA